MSKNVINTVIISDEIESIQLLKKVFESTQYKVIFESTCLDRQISGSWMTEPDLLIVVSSNLDAGILAQLKIVVNQYPLPIVVFTHVDMDDAIDQAIEAGISSYIVDGLHENRIIPILKTAHVRFTHQQKLLKQLEKLKISLADRKIIDRAKGLVMQQRQCTEDDAYKLLRTSAMKQNMRLAALSKTILEASILFN
jgi:response regulator NasT